MSGNDPVNTARWNSNSATLIESPLARLHRRIIFHFSLFDKLVKDKGSRIIDIGCGLGPFLSYFWSKNFRNLAAIEPDPELAKGIPSHIKLDLRHCPAEHIDFPDKSFDVVFVYGVLHHLLGLEAYREACQEIHRILKPGGLVFIVEPGRYHVFLCMEFLAKVFGVVSKTFRAFYETMEEERPLQHFFLKNHGHVRNYLHELGFSPLADKYFFYSWIFTAQKP
jgi:ubiquinone/menaquinone biosynthesis C-methylase UbiE